MDKTLSDLEFYSLLVGKLLTEKEVSKIKEELYKLKQSMK